MTWSFHTEDLADGRLLHDDSPDLKSPPLHGTLLTRVKYDGAEIAVEACESADEAPEALELRAGPAAVSLRDASVAVIGCGAVGSFVWRLPPNTRAPV